MWFFPYIWILFGAFFLIPSLLKIPVGLFGRSWSEPKRTIILSEVFSHGRSDSSVYLFRIHYSFEVLGKEYTSTSINTVPCWWNWNWGFKSYAGRNVDQYPVGKSVDFFYNLEDPGKSLLEPGVHFLSFLLVQGYFL